MSGTSRYVVMRRIERAVIHIAVYVGAVLMVVPFVFMILTSLKTTPETYLWPPTWLPRPLHLEAYRDVLGAFPFGRFYLNSILVSSAVMCGQLLLASMAGYALCFYRFRFKKLIFAIVLATMMLPATVTIIPAYIIVKSMGLVNSLTALVLPNLVTAFGIFLMRQFMVTLPYELVEAARVDGTPEFLIYWRIILPLCSPALASLGIFAFMQSWNDFLWPLIVISETGKRTLPLGLALMGSPLMTEWNKLMAGSVYALVPVLVIFVCFQRYFIKGMALSGLKI